MFIIRLHSGKNEEYLGDYTFYFRSISIGKNSNCSLVLPDKDLKELCLKIKQVDEGLLIFELNNRFYLSNDKKISGQKVHNVGDFFQIGEWRFEILLIKPMEHLIDYEARYNEITEKSPFMSDLFWAIKQEILHLEKKS